MPLLVLFIVVPLIEIALFIQIGSAIGLGWTLLIVVLTAIAGTVLVRQQGRDVLVRLQSSFEQLRDPTVGARRNRGRACPDCPAIGGNPWRDKRGACP